MNEIYYVITSFSNGVREYYSNLGKVTRYFPTARFGFRYEKIELRVGGKALLKKIEELRTPRIIFGHIHENGSKSLEKDGTIYYNVSILDQHYEIAHEPMVIDV